MNTNTNLIKIYKIANKKKFQVTFGAQPGGKWYFQIGSFTHIRRLGHRGGKIADTVAEIIRQSWFRCQTLDDQARAEIDSLCGVNHLKDYRPALVGRGFTGCQF